MILVAVTIGYLVTFGVFIAAVTLAMVTEHRKSRSAMRKLERDFLEIEARLGDEERGRR